MSPPLKRVRRSRDPPSPKPILDRKELVKALENANISLKTGKIDLFYQLLHRQHYPSLAEFVDTYYRNERGEEESGRKKNVGKQLPKKLLDFLKDPDNDCCTVSSRVQCVRTSADKSTTKLAVELHDGHVVESVIMRYANEDRSRATLCVSSQVGCAMGCTFCATGTMGIRGNLTCGEILEQLVHAGRILAMETSPEQTVDQKLVRNVVFMGMGEPLNNYNNVIEACRSLIDRKRWNLSHGRVTVSTVGVTPKIKSLTRDLPEVSLALSLHAPNQEMRSAIVPAAKNYPIENLIDALDAHMMARLSDKEKKEEGETKTRRRKKAMIEYVMLEGDTSSFECAHQLGKLCQNRHVVVNLIPYNQTDVKDKLKCPSEAHMKEFHRIVSSYGTFCTVRRTMGADITGACGQLVVQQEKNNMVDAKVSDIEDGPYGNMTSSRPPLVEASKLSKGAKQLEEATEDENGEEHDGTDYVADRGTSMEKWIQPLAVATFVAATCFVLSSVAVLSQKRQR